MAVVVDSSALIPLARIGRLDLVTEAFDEIHAPEAIETEVLVEGKRGTSALRDFLEDSTIHPMPAGADQMADLEGITIADAAVVSLARDLSVVLLANDKALIEVARTRGIDYWWVTTLLLKVASDGILSGQDASDLLLDLVDEGMNLHPRVYAKVQRALADIGE